MSRGVSMARIAVAAVLMLRAALAATTDEKPAPVANADSPLQPGAIAAAKKDFDTVKIGRDAALQTPGDLPRVAMPEWQGASPTGSVKAPAKSPTHEPKSANWLIDAMEKQARERDHRSADHDRQHGSVANMRSDLESVDRPDSRRVGQPGDTSEERRKDATEIANPFSRHLADWMTANDYTLLMPGVAGSLGDAAGIKGAAGSGSIGSMATVIPIRGVELMPGLTGAMPTTLTRTAPRENPYLSSLIGPESPAAAFATKSKTEMVAPAKPPVLPAISTLAPVPPPQSKIPEFVKPATDEKYFKPLKRF